MNTKCEQSLIQMFTTVIKGENDLESFRINLLRHMNSKGINYSNCFTHLSTEKILSQEAIADFLSYHSIKYDISELQPLNYQNFLDLLLPSKNLKEVKQRDLLFGVPIPETLKIIATIFEKELQINRAILAHLEILSERYERRQLLGLLPSLIPLCQKLKLNLKSDDYICLLRRFDKDLDNDIKQADWEYFLDRLKWKRQVPKPMKTYQHTIIDKENSSQIANSLHRSNIIAQRQKSTPDHPQSHKSYLAQQMKSFAKSRMQKQEIDHSRDYHKIHAYIEKLESQSQQYSQKQIPSYIKDDQIQQSQEIEVSKYGYSDSHNDQQLSQTQSYQQLHQTNEFQDYINRLQDIMDEILQKSKNLSDIASSSTVFNYLDIDMDDVLSTGDLKVFFVTQNIDAREGDIQQFINSLGNGSLIQFQEFQDLIHNHQQGPVMKLSLNAKLLLREIFAQYMYILQSLKQNRHELIQHQTEISQFIDPGLYQMIMNIVNSQ